MSRKTTPMLKDIEIIGISGTVIGSRRKPLTKSSRAEELRRETVELERIPSGKRLTVEIPAGHYTKKQMQRLREATKLEFLRVLREADSG